MAPVSGCVAADTEGSANGGVAGAGASGGSATAGVGGTGGTAGTAGGSAGASTGATSGSAGVVSVGAGTTGTSGMPAAGASTAGTGGAAAGASGAAAGGGMVSGGMAGLGGENGGGAGSGGLAGSGAGTAGQSSAGAAGDGASGSAGGGGTLCPSNAAFCEDFEDGNLDGWSKNESGGTLVVNAAKPAHGVNSLQVDVPAMQYGGAIVRNGAPLFPLPSQRMWGRLMIYFDTIADGHTDFIRGAASNGSTPQYNIAEQHGEVMLNYYNGSSADCWARPMPGKVVPLKTWMCWEWSFDGEANQMEFYIDGTLSRRVDGTGDGCLSNPTQTWVAPTFAELRIGEYVAERSPDAQRIWIDDIAVGAESRIGCP